MATLKVPNKMIKSLLFLLVQSTWLIHTVHAQTNICSLTATHTISDNQSVALSTWFPSAISTSNAVVDLGENAILTIDKSFEFSGSKFRCGKNALIVVQGTNVVFGLKTSILQTCGSTTMWEGIRVLPGTRIKFHSNWIYDAKRAIYFRPDYDDPNNELRFVQFINNDIGIQVGSVAGERASVGFRFCYGNRFRETSNLKDILYGTHAEVGIRVESSDLNFGTNNFNRNIFDGLVNGVFMLRGASATIKNSIFQNMIFESPVPDPGPNLPPFLFTPLLEGTGIVNRSSVLNVTSAGIFGSDFLNNVNYGIYGDNHGGELKVENATFSGNTEHFICASQTLFNNATVNIINNSFSLGEVRSAIFCDRPAIGAGFGDSHITGNEFTGASTGLYEWYAAPYISIQGRAGATNSFEVSDNIITHNNYDHVKHGIYLIGPGDNYLFHDNNIYYSGDPDEDLRHDGVDAGSLAIALESVDGHGNTISDNTIVSELTPDIYTNSYLTNDASFIKCGVHISNSYNVEICGNDVDSTYRGFHFADFNPGTIWGENEMNRHRFGLYFGNNTGTSGLLTDISSQFWRQNTWLANASDYDDDAVYYLDFYFPSTFGTVPFTIYCNPGQYMPPSVGPQNNGWIVPESNDPNLCSASEGLNDADVAIINREYPYKYDVQLWDLQKYLLGKIMRNPGLLANSAADGFFTYMENSSPYMFALALFEFENAYKNSLDSEWKVSLDDIHIKEARIEYLLGAIAKDTLTVDPLYADSLQKDWSDLRKLYGQFSAVNESMAEEKILNLQEVQTYINTLPETETWEKAWKTILSISVRRSMGEQITETAEDSLRAIHNECYPIVGLAKESVKAYWKAIDPNSFKICQNINSKCTEVEERMRSDVKKNAFMVYPNPSKNWIYANLQCFSEVEEWTLINTSGNILQRGTLNKQQSTLSLDISNYPPGFYILQVKTHSGEVHISKFAIVK